MTQLKLALFCGALAAAAPGFGAATVIGGGHARECYLAAEHSERTRPSIETCNAALDGETLSLDERASTLVNRGIVYMQARSLTAAMADFDAALHLRPSLAEAYVNKGIALLHLGGHDAEAVATLTDGLQRKPSRPEIAFYTRGIANEMVGATREAYEDYQQAVALKPDWAEPATQLQRFKVVKKPSAGV